jgi:tripartite-type tricarboxylate transporter receptor subunit TctC
MNRAVHGAHVRVLLAMLLAGVLAACSGAQPSVAPSVAPTSAPSAGASAPASVGAVDCGDYPNKDIELVIPASPGGGFDTWARLIAPYMEENLPGEAKVLPVNLPGAGIMLGTTEVYGAEPDGYTIGITEPGEIATQQLVGGTDVDTNAFSAIGRLTVSPELVVVAADSEHDTIEDVLAAGAATPQKLAMAGLAAVQVVSLDALQLPYTTVRHEGSSEAVLSIVRGDTDFAIFTLTSLTDDVEAGDVKPILIIGTRPQEGDPSFEIVKDTPTLDEKTGVEGLGSALEQHRILVAPPETPDCVVTMLEQAMLTSLENPELQGQLDEAGLQAIPKNAAETQEIMAGVLGGLEPFVELLRTNLEE